MYIISVKQGKNNFLELTRPRLETNIYFEFGLRLQTQHWLWGNKFPTAKNCHPKVFSEEFVLKISQNLKETPVMDNLF